MPTKGTSGNTEKSERNLRAAVASSWKRIDTWLEEHAPAVRASLRDGATEEQIRAAAESVGARLPREMSESYRIHDGQRGGPWLFADWALLSLDDLTTSWRELKRLLDDDVISGGDGDPTGPIRENWWHPKWIPVAHNSSGDFCCVDLAPAPGGNKGQIISYWHADARREVLAPGFAAWLHQFADDLEGGRYRVRDEWLERIE